MRLVVAKNKASAGSDAKEWKAYIASEKGKTLEIVITPSTSALVGSYSISTKVCCTDLSGEKTRFVKDEEKEAELQKQQA